MPLDSSTGRAIEFTRGVSRRHSTTGHLAADLSLPMTTSTSLSGTQYDQVLGEEERSRSHSTSPSNPSMVVVALTGWARFRPWIRRLAPLAILGAVYTAMGIFVLYHYKDIIPTLESWSVELKEAGLG